MVMHESVHVFDPQSGAADVHIAKSSPAYALQSADLSLHEIRVRMRRSQRISTWAAIPTPVLAGRLRGTRSSGSKIIGPSLSEARYALVTSGLDEQQPRGLQAATASPVVSSTPVLRLMTCTAAPDAPLPRLSSEATARICCSASLP